MHQFDVPSCTVADRESFAGENLHEVVQDSSQIPNPGVVQVSISQLPAKRKVASLGLPSSAA